MCGNAAGKAPRCYVRSIEAPEIRPATPEGVDQGVVAPDGKSALVRRVTGEFLLCPLDGGTPRPFPFVGTGDRLIRFSPDGTRIWVLHRNRVESVDPVNGHREPILELASLGGAGMTNVRGITLADDPRAYAYTASEYSSILFQIEGVK